MSDCEKHRRWIPEVDLWLTILALAVGALVIVLAVQPAHGQTYQVIHTFSGSDGSSPIYGLTPDQGGNLYGVAEYGGASHGVVFKLTHAHSGWVLNPLYEFRGGADGATPHAGVVFGHDGVLYGTTVFGGNQGESECVGGCGVVFSLRPQPTRPPTPLSPWLEKPLYAFNLFNDGNSPYSGVTFDQAGNMYGTTFLGGGGCCDGTVYELQPSGGGWAKSTVHSFVGGDNDGLEPIAGVTLDKSGNLYGVTIGGGPGDWGVVYELSPYGSGWTESLLYIFQNNDLDGAGPYGGLIFDNAGNIFGTTTVGGQGFGGTVFELSPSNGGWKFKVLYSFPGGNGPHDKLTMDAAGNLYGTTHEDGAYGYGNVFKLSPAQGGGWTYTSLYDFTNGNDGGTPYGGVILDASGNLYGTASGGAQNNGVIYEITP